MGSCGVVEQLLVSPSLPSPQGTRNSIFFPPRGGGGGVEEGGGGGGTKVDGPSLGLPEGFPGLQEIRDFKEIFNKWV